MAEWLCFSFCFVMENKVFMLEFQTGSFVLCVEYCSHVLVHAVMYIY